MQKGTTKKNEQELLEEMFNAGAHYGYGKQRRHPSVSPFIYATKNKVDMINLEKTNELLEDAKQFIAELASQGKVMLLVGTKPEAKELVKDMAEKLSLPYVTERWIGGTLSNFIEIRQRVTELENYQKESADGVLDKYTKKERLVLAKKMEKLETYYSGLIGMKKIPDALFIIDAKAEHIATTEARKIGIPIIALVNSDSNIKDIDYPIVGNDSGVASIKFFTSAIIDAYKSGQSSLPKTTT